MEKGQPGRPGIKRCAFCGHEVRPKLTEEGLEEGTLRFLYADGTEAEPLYFCACCEDRVANASQLLAHIEGLEFVDSADLILKKVN